VAVDDQGSGRKPPLKPTEKIAQQGTPRPDRGEKFDALAGPIKTRHKLGFIIDITSF